MPAKRLARLALALPLALVALAWPAGADATTVRRLSAADVSDLAHRIVEGRIVASHVVQVGGTELLATEYEMAVERVLKDDGSVAAQLQLRNGILVIRQAGATGPDGLFTGIVGMPRYEVGARYRLSLNGDSARGLTSPVGLGQGVAALPDEPAPPERATP